MTKKKGSKLELKDFENILKIIKVGKAPTDLIAKVKKKIEDLKKPKKKRTVEIVKYQCQDCHKEFKRSVFRCKECGCADLRSITLLDFIE